MSDPLNGKAMIAVSLGLVFVWSGVKGWSVLGTLGDLIQGAKPDDIQINPLAIPGGGNGISATGPIYLPPGQGSIASQALQYQGHAYSFGGAPRRDGSGAWDCSSFTNFVIGVRLGLAIPGYRAGAYDGSTHGPVTGQWFVWPGLVTIQRADVAVNDIIVWSGHMGMAISNRDYISAQNPRSGTRISSIDGGGHGAARYGRYRGSV